MDKAMRRPDSGKPPPTCKAFLLCERAIVEAETGSISVIGITDVVSAYELPAPVTPITAYLQLVDGIGSYRIHVEMLDLSTGEVIATWPETVIHFPERRTLIELVIPISLLPIEQAGGYDIVVLANEQEIGRQQLTVKEVGDSGDWDDETSTDEEGD